MSVFTGRRFGTGRIFDTVRIFDTGRIFGTGGILRYRTRMKREMESERTEQRE